MTEHALQEFKKEHDVKLDKITLEGGGTIEKMVERGRHPRRDTLAGFCGIDTLAGQLIRDGHIHVVWDAYGDWGGGTPLRYRLGRSHPLILCALYTDGDVDRLPDLLSKLLILLLCILNSGISDSGLLAQL
ncbi:hypothetical protein BDZ97DRAFT_1929993 [Flammula alnicola]|nr:hypothetical protein BDZ97DRAFT_1929993 [Flammula alnicola]